MVNIESTTIGDLKMSNSNKIRVAFIKFGGLAAGGTEKFFQIIAANLPKERFDVTYFYCEAAPYIGSDWKHPDTHPSRLKYMEDKNIRCVKFNVAYKDVTKPTHDWVDTDLWDVFNENEFDIVTSARSGHPEYPFTHIKNTPIVDTIHLPGLVDNQQNIEAVIHLSEWNKNIWIQKGGNASKTEVIYIPIKLPEQLSNYDFRKELGFEDKFIFGLHQRADDGIYSHVPLAAYEKIQTDNTAFVLMGGSEKYSQQAKLLDLKNFKQLEPIGEFDKICKFLSQIDVYAHGRSDGENNSQSIAEAMGYGNPIVSHVAPANGHIETIGDAGTVVKSIEEYAEQLQNLMNDKDYYELKSKNALNRFNEMYEFEKNIQKFVDIYERVYAGNQIYTADDDWLNDWFEE